MDTVHTASRLEGSRSTLVFSSPETIEPQELWLRLQAGQRHRLLDVRKAAARAADPRQIVGSQWRDPLAVADWAADVVASLPAAQRSAVVVYCVYGHGVGLGVARALRELGVEARALAGGMRGGEEGVDAAHDIARWRALPLTLEAIAPEAAA